MIEPIVEGDYDVGLSVNDVAQIKAALLHVVREGGSSPGEISAMCDNLISSFQALDAKAFLHTELERKAAATKS